jgi:hypothetical protein
MNAEGYLWIAAGFYFVMIGCGRLPVPKGGIGDWFDAASRERFRRALCPAGLGLIVVGAAICFRLL